MTSYDYKIAAWNHRQWFRGALYLVCLVMIYISSVTWHGPFIGHSNFALQLHEVNSLTYLLIFVDIYHARHVLCARITSLYSVSFENWVKFIRFWKVLIYQIQKSFSYVGGNNSIKRWTKPDDVAGAISFLLYVLFICIN